MGDGNPHRPRARRRDKQSKWTVDAYHHHQRRPGGVKLTGAPPLTEREKRRQLAHGRLRASERCECHAGYYVDRALLGIGRRMEREPDTGRQWIEFDEPSGKLVYGLWCDVLGGFMTFLTAGMWARSHRDDSTA